MRLQAKEDLSYSGISVAREGIFDLPRGMALELINQNKAIPYNLEDPSYRSDSAIDLSQSKIQRKLALLIPIIIGPLGPQDEG